jgi:hypothetical protein
LLLTEKSDKKLIFSRVTLFTPPFLLIINLGLTSLAPVFVKVLFIFSFRILKVGLDIEICRFDLNRRLAEFQLVSNASIA